MKLIDAEEFLRHMEELYTLAGWNYRDVHFSLADLRSNIGMEDIILIPRREPDTVQVIRCKDCIWFRGKRKNARTARKQPKTVRSVPARSVRPVYSDSMELISREKAIETLTKIRDARAKSCSRQAIMEAAAMQYAIEVVRRIPEASRDEDTD